MKLFFKILIAKKATDVNCVGYPPGAVPLDDLLLNLLQRGVNKEKVLQALTGMKRQKLYLYKDLRGNIAQNTTLCIQNSIVTPVRNFN